jgi:hypothetical protein
MLSEHAQRVKSRIARLKLGVDVRGPFVKSGPHGRNLEARLGLLTDDAYRTSQKTRTT